MFYTSFVDNNFALLYFRYIKDVHRALRRVKAAAHRTGAASLIRLMAEIKIRADV
jgi:hypothetical protein